MPRVICSYVSMRLPHILHNRFRWEMAAQGAMVFGNYNRERIVLNEISYNHSGRKVNTIPLKENIVSFKTSRGKVYVVI